MDLNPKQLAMLRRLLRAGAVDRAGKVIDRLDIPEIIHLLDAVGPSEHPRLLQVLFSPDRIGSIAPLRVIPRDRLAAHLTSLGDRGLARLLAPLSTDDAVAVLELLDERLARGVVDALSNPEQRALLEQAMAYPRQSAGRLMDTHYLAVPQDVSAQEAIELVRDRKERQASSMSDLYTVDSEGRLTGMVPFWRLVRADPGQPLAEIIEPDPVSVSVLDDQEDVATLATRYGFLAVPVLDRQERLVGIVTMDDVLDIIQQEAEEDLYRMQGVGGGDRLGSPVVFSLKRRLPWMCVNLVTAFVAASVVGIFEATIAQLAVLAVFMPVVAGMGGNAGTQVLTVVIRGIALGEDRFSSVARVVIKQMSIGLLMGVGVGVLTACGAYLWRGDPRLGLVLLLAMLVNMAVASFVGAMVPTLLNALRLDPALGSGVIVTTCTDVVGFFAFLGLASVIML